MRMNLSTADSRPMRLGSSIWLDSSMMASLKCFMEYLQCSQVCYSHYEMGKRDIPTDVLIRLADFYHTSTDYLLGRTDEKQAYPASKSKQEG